MKKKSVFLFENFLFLEVKFSIYLYRHVFVMKPVTHKQGATEGPPWSGLQKTVGEFELVFTRSELSLAAPHCNYKFGPHRGSLPRQ